MRKRIQQLARGKFEYARPLLSFSTDKVDIEVLEGKDYTGDFIITSANRVPMRGIIYTSNERMECLTPQFEGEEVRIRYQFHSNGLVEGDIQKGEFYIICNQGEYNLSFVASISKLYAETSTGRIRTLNDFVELARHSAPEAGRLFYSKNFIHILKPEEARERLLYEGLSKDDASGWKIEEFLFSAQKKKRVEIIPEEVAAEFYEVTESRKETINLQRKQWGYVGIRVKTDADFLVPMKAYLTEEDFIGSVCPFEYFIREESLHAGRNFGRLTFEMPAHTFSFEVCVSRGERREGPIRSEHREIEEGKTHLLKLYMDYRLKKIVTGVWANRSIEILDHMMVIEPDKEIYPLMKAQALIVNKQRQEASWIMEDFKRECTNRETPEWGYYLYLCTLMEREPSYVDRMAEEIEILFKKNPDSSLLFWVLLFVRDSYYRNNARRYKAIEQWVAMGNYSPYLYLEAYYLLWQDPYLLGKLGNFEIEVLNWARKQEAISRDIAYQVMHAVTDLHEFNIFVYHILEECYRVNPKEEMLAVICGYLIKGQCYECCYHKWYELGIAHEIRITGLYEAYLMSLDNGRVDRVPKMIQMYFQYDSVLPYQQKAALFVNIIAGRMRQPEVYQKYRRTMELFAMEQIEAGHIGDNLAVIYDEMLRLGVLNQELAHRLSKILFTHKLTCMDKHISQAQIWHKELANPQTVPVVNGTAYFAAYTKNYVIVLKNTEDNCFCESVAYRDETLMHPEVYLERCLSYAPDEWSYVLFWFTEREKFPECVEEKEKYFTVLLQEKQISTAFKQELLMELLMGYRRREYDFSLRDNALNHYLKEADLETMSVSVRRRLIELLTEAHLYEKAYRMVQMDGYDYLGSAARVALCSYAITEAAFEEDDFLLGFASSTFLLDKYNDVILIYLCKYYNAATKMMAKLWWAAGEFQIDTFDLEERILTQMLYTTDYTPYAEQIYDSYYAGGGRELVCLAYLSYFANSYLRQDALIPGHVFIQIQERYLDGQELNEACRLGLLKHLAERDSLTEKQMQIADALLGEYVTKNICFDFYRKFERKLILKYQLYDKFFLEYHAEPGKQVKVNFRMDKGVYQTEDLVEMYDGIYVKEFILFFGETVQYYITEAEGMKSAVIESNCISNNDVLENDNQGRYAKLNEMLLQNTLGDDGVLKRQMKNYYGMTKVTEEVFKLL